MATPSVTLHLFCIGATIIGTVTLCSCRNNNPADITSDASAISNAIPPSIQTAELTAGTDVIVETDDAVFTAAVVVEAGEFVTCEAKQRKKSFKAPADRVYPVGVERTFRLNDGDFAACLTGSMWSGCVVRNDTLEHVEIEDAFGKNGVLSPANVIPLRHESQQRVASWLQNYEIHRAFFAESGCSQRPERNPEWEARPGEEILALYEDGTWRAGKVRRLTPDKLHVSWDDRTPFSIRDAEFVIPRPKKPQVVNRGQRVLARPRKGSIWECCLVDKVEKNSVAVVDRAGGTRKLRTSDVVPLVADLPH